jgi:endonuclease-3
MTFRLQPLVQRLAARYGPPAKPLSDPFELIIWENIAYLVDDERRAAAFTALGREVGLAPVDIMAASKAQLTEFTQPGGIHAELRAQRLKESAQIVLVEFGGDLASALKLPLKKAMNSLKKFPSIGEPGAEKILLFTRSYPVLALDSNGLRVLLRLGYGEEKKSYSASYKSVKEATANELGTDVDFLISAHLLLKQHGQETCKRNNPRCDECVLRSSCAYAQSLTL